MRKKIILAILVAALVSGGFFIYKFFKPAVSNKADTYFYIKPGETVSGVKRDLVSQNYISGDGFALMAKFLKFKTAKPGRYKLKNGMNLYSLIRLLRSGNQSLVKMVIIKERTNQLFAGKFGKGKKFDTEFDSLQMIRYLSNNDSLKRFGVDSSTALSIIMPYTYEIKWNTTPGKVFQQFHTAYQKFWTAERKAKADSLGLTPLQVVSLASIVEEETNKKADKFKVASTYLNRVKKGMRLQADPTVKFAMKNFTLKRILGSYLKTESPYNTYIHAGIPPGPICTPSAESIDAVLNAPATNYIYFVASHKFDGSSIFTTDYNDHLKFARLYQAELTRRMDSSKKARTQ